MAHVNLDIATKPSKDVFSLGYMRLIRFLLNTLGQWPNRMLGDESRLASWLLVYNYTALGICTLCGFNLMLYAKMNVKKLPFIDAGQCYTNLFLDMLYIQRSTLSLQKKYCSVVKEFILKFHLMHHEDKNSFAAQEYRRINKICKIGSIVYLVEVTCGILGYNLVPLYQNYNAGMFNEIKPENKTFIHSIYFVLPFDYSTDTTGYFIVFCFNFIASYWVPSAMCYYDFFVFIILFHVSGHLNIVINTMINFPRLSGDVGKQPKEIMEEYNKAAFIQLKDVIQHYQVIKEFMTEMGEALDFTLCTYLAFHQLMCCLLLLECSTLEPEAMVKYGMLTFYVFEQCILMSVIFEHINVKSESLGDRVYSLPWEQMDVKNRKILLMLLRNVQNPLALKAGGMVPVGVRTMSSIMRTSCSYFLFLKTFAD
uniref:Odorant receptor n=1 Tax=Grapholita molesta TaxID=192188 RepID=A0A9Y1IS93_GRAMO|nr:odorant-receptor-6.2 [Grapholita molesta]